MTLKNYLHLTLLIERQTYQLSEYKDLKIYVKE